MSALAANIHKSYVWQNSGLAIIQQLILTQFEYMISLEKENFPILRLPENIQVCNWPSDLIRLLGMIGVC